MWLNRHKLNNSLVVFLHGLLGSRWTWRFIPDVLQPAFHLNPLLRSYDFYLFHYRSTWLRQPNLDPFVLQQLDRFLSRIRPKYQSVVLIGHSQGGILAKLFLVDKSEAGELRQTRVDLVLTIGTPHQGVLLAAPLHWLHKLPWIGQRLWFQQTGDLASVSSNIRRLQESWNEEVLGPERPRSVAIVGAYDRIVGRESARGFAIDVPSYAEVPHPLARGSADGTIRLVRLIHEELESNQDPAPLLQEIFEIRSNDERRHRYFQDFAPQVGAIVAKHRPEMTAYGIEVKAASLLWDFLYDLPQRPLRCLSLLDALTTYCHRQFGQEI